LALAALVPILASCGDTARFDESRGFGPKPELPQTDPPRIATLSAAWARGWREGEGPIPAQSLRVGRFAGDLDHPRWLYVLPNGDVLVAESKAPEGQWCHSGFKWWIEWLVLRWSGAAGTSADRITLLRDADGDGVAELRMPLLTGLKSPFGMALVGGHLYVANTDAVVRFPYEVGTTQITAMPERVVGLPANDGNCHWTRNLLASRDGTRLFVTVGSTSDHGEKGPAPEKDRAAILSLDLATRKLEVFASGLRNPNGLDWEPSSGALWTTVNERDELGSDLVPDYMTAVQEGSFHGWPCRYFGDHPDTRAPAAWNCSTVGSALKPDYALGPHTASLGLAFARGNTLPEFLRSGAFVAQHGSWNRRPRSGYKVIFVPFKGSKPNGDHVDVLIGFADENKARGRPTGVAIDRHGALLVADDVGNTVWRVTAAPAAAGSGR